MQVPGGWGRCRLSRLGAGGEACRPRRRRPYPLARAEGADVTPDRMSSRERWEALVRGADVDRVPCLQFILGHTAVVSGKPIAKIYDDAADQLRLPARRHGDVRLRRTHAARLGQRRRRRVRRRGRVPLPQVHRRPHDEEEPGGQRRRCLEPRGAGRRRPGRHRAGGPRVLPAAVRSTACPARCRSAPRSPGPAPSAARSGSWSGSSRSPISCTTSCG